MTNSHGFPAKAGTQGSGNRCDASAWTPAFAGERGAV